MFSQSPQAAALELVQNLCSASLRELLSFWTLLGKDALMDDRVAHSVVQIPAEPLGELPGPSSGSAREVTLGTFVAEEVAAVTADFQCRVRAVFGVMEIMGILYNWAVYSPKICSFNC